MSSAKIKDLSKSIGLKQLKYALVTAELGSFRRAAEALNVRQSTLSRSIRQLEDATSIKIFDRSPKGVATSVLGHNVIQTAKTVLEQLEFLGLRKGADSDAQRGVLRVGFCTSLSLGGLRTSLLEFRSRTPQFRIETFERSRSRLSLALQSGALDVVIVPSEFLGRGHRSKILWSERVLIAMPQRHPLADREAIYWTDLRREILLMTEHDPYREFEDLITSKLLLSEDRPTIERHDVSRSILKSLISMEFGLGLMLESDAGIRIPSMTFKELRDGSGPTRVGFSAFWRETNANPALLSFIALVDERYQSLPSGQ
jgi:DNA-binding transcriptional LysR family regulator